LYKNYASIFSQYNNDQSNEDANQEALVFEYYFRGWLPERADSAICDLGCGDGGLLRLLAARGYRELTGVDVSPEQLGRARGTAARLIRGDALEHLDGAPGRYDLLIARDLVEHLSKDELLRFLALARAALRPGGRLVVQTPNGDSPLAGSVRYGDLTHELCLTPELARRLLAHAGFQGFEAREAGPIPSGYSPISTARYALWKAARALIQFYNLIELGNRGSGVFTRVFLLSASRPARG
jgi:SAM-dependent methyltransferase